MLNKLTPIAAYRLSQKATFGRNKLRPSPCPSHTPPDSTIRKGRNSLRPQLPPSAMQATRHSFTNA